MFDDTQSIGITVLGSGSKGNATIIHSGKDAILIDAGFSRCEFMRRLEASSLPSDMRFHAILITHEHTDHVNGLRPLAKSLGAPVYATRRCADVLMAHKHLEQRVNLIAAGGAFELLGFRVTPFSVPHDAVDPVAFSFSRGGVKIGVATDFGLANMLVQYELRNCSTLVLESNHDLNMLAASSRPWTLKQRIMGNMGHLSNVATCELLRKIVCPELKNLVLAHLSGECNTSELAYGATWNCLEQLGRTDVRLAVARQEAPIPTVWL